MIRLVVKRDKKTVGDFEFNKRKINIGRLPENDIVLSMDRVSRFHAIIDHIGSDYIVTNRSAGSKAQVNDEPIDSVPLKTGDVITIAPFTIEVVIEEEEIIEDTNVNIARPKRWDVPFGANMTDADVDYVLSLPPFSEIDQSKFPASASLRDILRNDTRVLHFKQGDIVIREGDYGNSAFAILSGSVRVVLGRGKSGLPSSTLGRRRRQAKNFLRRIAQLWSNPNEVEVRNPSIYKSASDTRRKSDEGTRIFLQDVPKVLDKYNTASLKSGEFFGEIAALSRTPRTASVVAEQDSTLLEIRWQGLRDIRKRAKDLKEYIDKIYRENNLRGHIKEHPMFKHLNEEQIDTVVENTIFETYGDFEWYASFKKDKKSNAGKSSSDAIKREPIIAEEGNYPAGIIMIRSGFARLSQKIGHGHRTIAYLGAGSDYGFEELAHNWRSKQQVFSQKSLRAVGYTDVLIVPTKIMEEIVLPSYKKKLPPLIKPSKRENLVDLQGSGVDKIGSHMMEFLVENRFINGTATMMINLDRCVRCDDCVRACAAAHGNNPRFVRHGQQNDKFMVANACMHCSDPVCMLGCPTGAIHRDSFEGQVVINDITCIGCQTCANSCPYDNIRMVEIRDDEGNFILDEATNGPIYKATKCDLCVDQKGGPSCERACPHDALKRVDMRDLETLAKWINR